MRIINSLKGDKIIWIVVLSLSIFSFLPVYSASSNFGVNLIFSSVFKHVAIIFIGILIMYATHLLDYKYLRGLSLIILPLAILLVVMLVLPSNFSTSFMIFSLSLILIFIGQYPIKKIVLIIFSGIILSGSFVGLSKTYPDLVPNRIDTWSNRIENFINPSLDNDSNYQINRAKAAIASGSIFGVGAGKSSMKYILPQSTSDFIFSIVTEEYGLFVALIILLLYVILLFRIVIVSQKSNNYFGKLLALAVGLPIVFQALINMGVAVQLFPVTGQPLPLISTGGTSIWTTFFAFGVLLSVSRNNANIMELDLSENVNE